jgi:tetratricopeptide (TPR) repeat protein
MRGPTYIAAVATLLWSATGAAAQEHVHALGTVAFENSCRPAVQEELQRGVAMLHSFYYTAGAQAFEDVLAKDDTCAIAAWGLASILMANPLQGVGAARADAPRAQAAIEKGRVIGARTERERDYIEAVAAYYEGFAAHSESERQVARAQAYERLAAKYPTDDEAQIFRALYLAATQRPTDQTYAAWLKAAELLEPQFLKYPNHPGVAHYLIHSYDAAPIAQRGLAAARRYAEIAPDAPHALHMPSHIFTRLGEWADSAAINRRSADSARRAGNPDEALHALDYMTYANLQLARDRQALAGVHEGIAITGLTGVPPGPYALAALPARYAIERNAWRDAAKLTATSSAYPQTEALTHLARALGAARSGSPAAARADAARITALRDQLTLAKNDYWAKEVEVMRLAALAWTVFAEKNSGEGLVLMRQAADIEDSSEKNIVTPGRLLPAREMLGDMLLESGRPADALKEYELSQKREPNRFRALYGAAEAAARSGDRDKARGSFSRLIELAGSGEPRPELQRARRYLAAN